MVVGQFKCSLINRRPAKIAKYNIPNHITTPTIFIFSPAATCDPSFKYKSSSVRSVPDDSFCARRRACTIVPAFQPPGATCKHGRTCDAIKSCSGSVLDCFGQQRNWALRKHCNSNMVEFRTAPISFSAPNLLQGLPRIWSTMSCTSSVLKSRADKRPWLAWDDLKPIPLKLPDMFSNQEVQRSPAFNKYREC